MSTRASIKIKKRVYLTDADMKQKKLTEREILLYHHYEGFPEVLGSDLKAFLKDRNDYESGVWNVEKIATDLVRGVCTYTDPYTKEEKPDMDFLCAVVPHADSIYLYVIDCDNRTLKCYIG